MDLEADGEVQRNNIPRNTVCSLSLVSPSYLHLASIASLMALMVKNLPETQETLVRSLGREDPLEKEMATHSSIIAWRIPWTEEPGGHRGGPPVCGVTKSQTQLSD